MPFPESFPRLDTARLRLREIFPSDASAYLAVFGNAHHMRLFGADPPPDLEAVKTLIDAESGSYRLESPHLRWAIEDKDSQKLIGNCGIFSWNRTWRRCSVGFALGEEFQGNGYMGEALTAMLSWSFDFLGLNRVDAQVHTANARSFRVLDKLGFLNEGRLRQIAYWGGQYHDMFQYSLLRADWTPRQQAGVEPNAGVVSVNRDRWERSRLIFFTGKMASGKSTLAAKIAREKKAVLLVEDHLLNTLYPGEILSVDDFERCDQRVRASLFSHVCSLLSTDVTVVLDFPGNTRSQRNWFRKLIEASGANHELHWIDVSDDLCKRQLKKRSDNLPPSSPWTTEAEFNSITAHFQVPQADEFFNVIRHE